MSDCSVKCSATLPPDRKEIKMDRVSCGFGKWSIGWDHKGGAVVVQTCHHPIYEELKLYDASKDDLKRLGEFFLALSSEERDNASEED